MARDRLLRPLFHLIFCVLCGAGLFTFVDLTPKIDQNFFFASDAPQLQGSRRLEELFDLPSQIILVAEGDIRFRPYLDRVASFTQELEKLEGVRSVYSLGAGPGSVEGAVKSPLWSRLVIAAGERGSNFVVTLDKDHERQGKADRLVERIKDLKAKYDSPDFRLSITGTAYVVHEIQKQLVEDMRNFTLAAIAGFALVLLLIYRSGWILLGALVCATTAAFLDFIALKLLSIEPGPLSANLWSIVFILTLSHVVFISGNWERAARTQVLGRTRGPELVAWALRETGTASIWSMITNSLGFLTLTFTAAKPIQQFGLAGMVGAVLALLVAYSVFPPYLRLARPPSRHEGGFSQAAGRFVSGRHFGVVALMLALALVALTGFRKIDTQPPLFTYFEREGRLREDLIRIDRLGGASPLYIAVRAQDGKDFGTSEAYLKLWHLQLALEGHPTVGEIVSLPALLSQFVESPFAPLLTWDLIYSILDAPLLGSPGRGFVTQDRQTALFLLRMKESELHGLSRERIIGEIHQIVRDQGFAPVLTGGLFQLAGELSTLVSKSLLQGVFGLTAMLFLIALFVSRSWSLSLAVVSSLVLVPIGVLGAAGHLRLPLEIISTPGINLAMGLGVDEMIHLVHRARTSGGLEEAKRSLWKPISTSCLMLGLGFFVFSLSHFPPTRNMGWLVVIGSAMAVIVMLLVFPTVASLFDRKHRSGETVSPDLPRKAA